jgi:tetrahydromethanopterin S-methyltransferase subunit G
MQTENKPITIDALAVMINNGFKEADKRIDSLETKLNTKIDNLEDRMNTRMDSLEVRLNTRMDNLEDRLNLRIDTLESSMNLRFNGVQNQLDNIYMAYTPKREHGQLKVRVAKIESKLSISSAA